MAARAAHFCWPIWLWHRSSTRQRCGKAWVRGWRAELTSALGRKQPSALASGELPESWLGTVGTALVVVARHEGAALAHEKVEIRAFVCLQHVVEIPAPVAPRERGLRLFPFPAPLRELLLRNKELEPALRDVELDFVAVLDECEHAARRGFRRDVQHHRSVGGAAHARVRDANHVG